VTSTVTSSCQSPAAVCFALKRFLCSGIAFSFLQRVLAR
jgi:hypothetical protein